MAYTILLFAYRLPGTTPSAFKTHYENHHVPLLKSIAGELWPTSHTRSYISRPSPSPENEYPAIVLMGSQEHFPYDSVTELVFEDEEAFGKFFACVSQPENAARIQADEEVWLDRGRTSVVVVGSKEGTE